jgi:hypothetical protein
VFDGVGDYVSIPDNDSLNPGLSDFTFEFWVNTTDTTNGYILDKRSGCGLSSFYNVHIDVSGGIVFEIAQDNTPTNYNDLHSPVSVNDGAWHHVAVVRQGVTATIYTDGAASTSASTEGITNISNSHALTIGTGSCNLQFGGEVDELTYYNSALSASTVAAIYSAGSAGKCKPEIFVSSIDPSYMVSGHGFQISTSIVIQDVNGIGISDATVQLGVILPSGSALTFPLTTDATGQADISFTVSDSGLYKFKVRNVNHPIREYDASLNIETSDTLVIP